MHSLQTNNERDLYFCTCYIPPEDSPVYRNVQSNLFEFDFFKTLSDDILMYSNMGNVYLTGDFNSRTGQLPDFVENLNLDRFISLPDNYTSNISNRLSQDKTVNAFGHKLISLLKMHSLLFVNGRLEHGKYTYHCVNRNGVGGSVVDYLITNQNNFEVISNFEILDITEYSDHCPLTYNLLCKHDSIPVNSTSTVTKILWDSSKSQELLNILEQNRTAFNNITQNILNNEGDLDENFSSFSNLIYNCTVQSFGKEIRINKKNK